MQNCYVCKEEVKKGDDTVELYKKGHPTGNLIHRRCVDENVYGFCPFCGQSIVHPDKDLNKASECTEHRGESPDQEEQEGWDDIIENLNKDG